MDLFNIKREQRTEHEWKNILNALSASLGKFIGKDVLITDYLLSDYSDKQASFEAGVDILIQLEAQLTLCGVIGYLVNYDEEVYITAFLLPFVNGTRLSSVDKSKEQIILSFTKEEKWINRGWQNDEHDEWESYTDNERWLKNG